tara:strand:- start:419 stop:1279 length:861 start_codon:yes stop_codon:yes gene_type:complete
MADKGTQRFLALLNNYYSALFERRIPRGNTILKNVLVIGESVSVAEEGDSPFMGVPTAVSRYYADLTAGGSDADSDADIYGFENASSTTIAYGSGVLDETAMVLVFRVRPDWASGAPTGSPTLFRWRDDANNFIGVDFNSGAWRVRRANGGSTDTHTESDTFSSGDKRTITVVLTATTIGIAIDDGQINTTASTNIPTLTAATFDLGSEGSGATQFEGGLYWAFIGVGTADDDDVDDWDAFGDAGPLWYEIAVFGSTIVLTFFWDCSTGVAHEAMNSRYGEATFSA